MSFGAGNESDGKDVTQFLTHVAQIRDKLNCHVMLVHRSGKDRARGPRQARCAAYVLRRRLGVGQVAGLGHAV